MENVYLERARRGMALLDERGPEDWRSKVDSDWLVMSDPSRCVLAQVYGHYTTALEELDMGSWSVVNQHQDAQEGDAAYYGFACTMDEFLDEPDCYVALVAAWQELLEVRP